MEFEGPLALEGSIVIFMSNDFHLLYQSCFKIFKIIKKISCGSHQIISILVPKGKAKLLWLRNMLHVKNDMKFAVLLIFSLIKIGREIMCFYDRYIYFILSLSKHKQYLNKIYKVL